MRVLGGELLEGCIAGEDVAAEGLELRDGVVAGGGGDEAALGVLPGGLAAGALVLDEDVRSPNLLRRGHFGLFTAAAAAVLVPVVVVVVVGSIGRRLPLPIGLYFGEFGNSSLRCGAVRFLRLDASIPPFIFLPNTQKPACPTWQRYKLPHFIFIFYFF